MLVKTGKLLFTEQQEREEIEVEKEDEPEVGHVTSCELTLKSCDLDPTDTEHRNASERKVSGLFLNSHTLKFNSFLQ